jgi:curved DNA-binding protein CbpA
MEQYERSWKNYYEILQVSPNAEPSVITAAYKRLAQVYYPDAIKDRKASARMADISEAYEVLSNPVRRSEYDRAYRVQCPAEETEGEALTEEEIMVGLMRFAAEQAAKGKKRSQVADELTKQGVPYDVSAQIVQRVFEYRSELKRKEGGKAIGCGLLMLVVGGVITGVTYAAAEGGGIYVVTTGLFIVGGITLIVGLYKWLTS